MFIVRYSVLKINLLLAVILILLKQDQKIETTERFVVFSLLAKPQKFTKTDPMGTISL